MQTKNWQKQYLDLKNQVKITADLLEKLIVENNQQKLKITTLETEIVTLKLKDTKLSSEVTKLSKENIKLKDRLGLNSKNSSIPTSKELYKIKNTNKKKSDKKQGAQMGHKVNTRDKIIANEVIKVDLDSTKCECGGEIGIINKTCTHQKIDIPEIVPHVTDYELQKGRCKSCGKRKTAKLPSNVTPDLFGARVKTLIGALTGFYKNSKRDVANILINVFNIEISVGTISNIEARISDKCNESYEDIELELSYTKMLHMDETGHHNKGKLGWCWLFSSTALTMIKLTNSRGKKVLINSIFGKDDHLVISDRYAAYNYFNAKNRQVCWSHLARDFERFANSSYDEIKHLGKYLTDITRELFALKKALDREQISESVFLRRAKKIRNRVYFHLKKMSHETERLQAGRMSNNILKSEEMMWRFLDDPINIPLTNNHAEQQIRHYVTYRKNSYFTQSERGNRYLERIISLYLTWKKQDKNPVQHLHHLMIA